MGNYQGDIPVNFLAKRAKLRRQKENEIAGYNGDMLVRTLNKKAKALRKKDKKIATYQGDIIIRRKQKGMHPSAVWKGGRMKGSYKAKEKYRKRILNAKIYLLGSAMDSQDSPPESACLNFKPSRPWSNRL